MGIHLITRVWAEYPMMTAFNFEVVHKYGMQDAILISMYHMILQEKLVFLRLLLSHRHKPLGL